MIQNVMKECDNRCYSLKEVFQELNLTLEPPKEYIHYEQVFSSPWAPHISLEQRHEELTQKMSKWPMDDQMQVDPIMVFCLCHVMLFSTDFIQVKDPSRVGQVQFMYLNMLHRYLKFKYHSEANKRLSKGIMLASMARESYEICQKRLPV